MIRAERDTKKKEKNRLFFYVRVGYGKSPQINVFLERGLGCAFPPRFWFGIFWGPGWFFGPFFWVLAGKWSFFFFFVFFFFKGGGWVVC